MVARQWAKTRPEKPAHGRPATIPRFVSPVLTGRLKNASRDTPAALDRPGAQPRRNRAPGGGPAHDADGPELVDRDVAFDLQQPRHVTLRQAT
jgi:hypothetical protein